jgi:DnaJ homolog subfamily C member 7
MPFSLSHVLTEENLITEFICAICQQLADPPAYTKCTHVFCAPCIQQWMRRNSEAGGGCRCPTCNANLPAAALGTLKGACPLGWRVLSKVRCACPLREQGCTWTGEFSEVSPHLTNSDSHVRGGTGGPTGGAAAATGQSSGQRQPSLKRSLATTETSDGPAAEPSSRQPTSSSPTAARHGTSAGSTQATAEALKEQGNALFEQRQYSDAVKLYSKAIALQPGIATYYTNRCGCMISNMSRSFPRRLGCPREN